jgi:hypothetical protein
MRPSAILRTLFLISALIWPALMRAQFQEPMPEELKMTADPKAPGAAAEYLYFEENCNDESEICNFYERIKVLSEKGKEMATVRVPFTFGIPDLSKLQGRTIHSDGTIVPLVINPDRKNDAKTIFIDENSLVFNLPSVEVGSILEYRFTTLFSGAPTWWIQQSYFVRKEHFSFTPAIYFNQLLYTVSLPPGTKVGNKGRVFALDMVDVPPYPDEDWMPPLNTIKWNVDFFYSDSSSGKKFWDESLEHWANEINHATDPSRHLKKDVAEIIAPGDTDLQKAIKIYDVLQKLDNTNFSRQKTKAERKQEKLKEIKTVEDVWNQKSGNGDDIVLLYAAMARAAGLTVRPIQVVNRDRAFFNRNYLSLRQLDDLLVDVVIDGKDVYLDPGQKMCPFGSLHWKHAFATGLQVVTGLATTPAITFKDSMIRQSADLTVDETGDVKGTVRISMTGPEALYWRQLALENDEAEVSKQFVETIQGDLPEGVQADFDHFTALDDPSMNLVAALKVFGSVGSTTGKHFFLPGLFFETRAKHPFVAQEKRVTPIDLHYPKMVQDDVVYHLPAGYTVESAPKTSDVNWPKHAALRILSDAKDGTVSISRTFVRNFTLIDSSEYNDLHDFYLKLAAADQQQLVLTRVQTEKGN